MTERYPRVVERGRCQRCGKHCQNLIEDRYDIGIVRVCRDCLGRQVAATMMRGPREQHTREADRQAPANPQVLKDTKHARGQ